VKKYLLIFLSISLMAATCRKIKQPIVIKDSYVPQFGIGPNTLFKFNVISWDGKPLELKLRLHRYDDTCSFSFSMMSEYVTSGTITIPAQELKTARALHNFTDGDIILQDKTMMWMSEAAFIELKTLGKTLMVPYYRDTVELMMQGKETLTISVDGSPKDLICLRAEGISKGKKQSYLILDDQRFPMILAMETGWKVKLVSIYHVPPKAMTLQEDLFEFKPGLRLIYSLELFGCQSDIAFEFKEMTADSITFSYENYEYECLYGDEDQEYSGTMTISRNIWESPTDFQLFLLGSSAHLMPGSSYPGHPFFMPSAAFKTLFERGKADCPVSHTDNNPDEEDFEDMDSTERAEGKKPAMLYPKTSFVVKTIDVETGYRMFPLTIDGEEKRVPSITAVADLVGNEKILYLYPSSKFPLYLYHYDDVLSIEWTLLAVEYFY
jgi:hypothetical protein